MTSTAPVVLDFRIHEATVLAGLVSELIEVVGAPELPDDDPLAAFEATSSLRPLRRDDPVINRLFPSAYADEDLDAEYRRLTQADARLSRDHDARLVLDDLHGALGGALRVRLADDHIDPWLRTLNALRVAIAARLGVVDDETAERLEEVGPEDPDLPVVAAYHWLGYLLEVILDRL
ncbi:MAG: DUF2017 domain-containing protein [Propionibacteriaceae bacterium]|jgi:hypothetical protein|nr:DUF2017 domain-containing protein [Propionibacteriaceae bacterium]